jgi:hypothetical protein
MADDGGPQRATWPWLRTVLLLVDVLLTYAFASVFAWAWTDEAVSGQPFGVPGAPDETVTGIQGAAAGLVPTVVGLVLCAAIVRRSELKPGWPMALVVGVGLTASILGAASRFAEGLPPSWAVVPGVLAVVAAGGFVVDLRELGRRRKRGLAPVG